MQTQRRDPQAVSLWEATGELISAGQQVILDRVELLRSEITDDLRDVLWGGTLIVAACAVASFGWIVAMAALVVLLGRSMPMEAGLLVVGLPHIMVGCFLALMALRRFRHLTLAKQESFLEATDA